MKKKTLVETNKAAKVYLNHAEQLARLVADRDKNDPREAHFVHIDLELAGSVANVRVAARNLNACIRRLTGER